MTNTSESNYTITETEENNQKVETKKVETKKSPAEMLTHFNKGVSIFLIAIGGGLVAFSIIIIGNTIKLTVHARRKEISIMKYVGATNSFIRAPFMIEGVIIGIMSSAISLGIVGALYNWGTIKMAQSETIQKIGVNMLQFKDLFSSILIVYIILGVGIGIIGSRISMRKYLDV